MKYEQNLLAFALSLVIVCLMSGVVYGLLWCFRRPLKDLLPPPSESCERDVFKETTK